MTLWPEEYEALREEARSMGAVAAEMFATAIAGLDQNGRLEFLRSSTTAQEEEAPGGRDETIAGVACRVFDPAGQDRRGTYLHLHGGAMTAGSPRMNDTANDLLASNLGVRVVSVDYRLAPEHPHPAGSDDCLAVAAWVLANEPGPIAIGGESAGAYFAALTLLRIRDELGLVQRIAGANLVFGVYDLTGTPSHRGSRPTDLDDILDDRTDELRDLYLAGGAPEEARLPSVSPLFADLLEMPPALFTVGLADHLLDDSLFMAARWQAFGNEAELAIYPDCIHGFTFFPVAMAARANERCESFLDGALTSD
jgi:acetyl esterase/lipase